MTKEKDPVIFPEKFGFCEGVKAADNLLKDVAALAKTFGIETVYGYHEIVHNDSVIREHEANGVRFVDDLAEIPDQSVVITSAHGVGPEVIYALEQKGSTIFEAACPLVLRTQQAVEKARQEHEKVIYICKGKPGSVPKKKLHDEVQGVVGHLDYSLENGELRTDPVERSYVELTDPLTDELLSSAAEGYRIVTQTTLNADDCLIFRAKIAEYIQEHQPGAKVSQSTVGDVCRAVTDRQKGVAELVAKVPERIVIATDPKSKNGMGYRALAESLIAASGQSTEVYSVATVEEAEQLGRIDGLTGLTASASTPDSDTFGVAQALGINQLPDIDRKAFKLLDGNPDVIFQKLTDHYRKVEK